MADAYKDWRTRRFHETGAWQDPQSWSYVPNSTHGDWYNLDNIMQFVDAATKYNVPINDYLALGVSESGLGNKHPSNPARVNYEANWENLIRLYPDLVDVYGVPGKNNKTEMFAEAKSPELGKQVSIDFGAKRLSDLLAKNPNNRIRGIQKYSGAGKRMNVGYKSSPKAKPATPESRFFGKKLKDLDFHKQPEQALRVDKISKDVSKDTRLQELINEHLMRTPIPSHKQVGLKPDMSKTDESYLDEQFYSLMSML